MTLPLVGVRLTAQDLNRYVADMAKAERANKSFEDSVRRGATSANRGFADIGASSQRNTRALSTGFEQAGRSASTFGQSVVRGVGAATGALATLGAVNALGGFARGAFDTRVTFERELANVGALARATVDEVQSLSNQAEELGASTSFSATDVLGGQQFLAVAGFEVDDIITALPGLLSTAAAAQEDLAITSDIVSNALSGFNLEAEQTGRVSDVLVAGLTSSNTDLRQLGTALSFVAPNASALGVSIEESTAAIGLLSNAGIQGSRAGTTLRGVFNRLAAPTAEATAEMERLGIEAFTTEGNLKALPEVVAEFERGLDGLNDQQRAESINSIVGVIAGTGFTALLSAGSEELANFTEELENSGGVAEQVASRQLDNLAGDITRVSSAYEGLQLAITRRATPALRSFIGGAVLPAITGTTAFIEVLNDGGSAIEAVATGLSSLSLGAFRLEDDLFDVDLGDVFTGSFDFTSALGTFNINDFITGQLDFGLGDTAQQISVGDFLDFSLVSADDFIELNINDIITGTFDVTSAFGTFSINDFITGEFDSGLGTTSQKLKIGDFFDFSTFDFGAELGTATKVKIGDLIDFTSATTDGVSSLDINNIITGTYDTAAAFGTIAISDIITGSLDFGTGEGSITLGGDNVFEFDLGELNEQVQSQLAGAQASITGSSAITDGGIELAPATDGIAQQIQAELTALQTELSGLTFEEAAFSGLLLAAGAIKTASDTISTIDVTGIANLTAISTGLESLNTILAGATGEGSALADFVVTINDSLSGLAATIDGVDAASIGASFTGAIESVLGIFTTLNTIDDLALGGIAGSLGDVTSSILTFATDFTAGLDSEALGAAAAESASLLIGSFSAVLSEPDIPEIAGAAAGLVSAIGASVRTALESGDFESVGAEFGSLASTLLEQIGSTLSDPQFAEDIGSGFADILVGITQGLSDAVGGFNEEIDGAESSVAGSITIFTSNLISAIATGLESADYSSIVASLIKGIGTAIVFGGSASESERSEIIEQVQQSREEQPSVVENIQSNARALGELFGFVDPVVQTGGQTLENADVPVQFQDLANESATLNENAASATSSLSGLNSQLVEIQQVTGLAPAAGGQTLENVGIPVQFQDFASEPVAPTGGQTLQNVAVPVQFQALEVDTEPVDALSESTTALTGNATSAAASIAELSTQIGSIPTIAGTDDAIPEARRSGLGGVGGFDEDDVSGSINDQIASQLNFGDLPNTVSETVATAIQSAIPSEPIIDSQSVNNAILTAAQEAIPASEIPEFPSWQEVVDFNPPRLPRFPGWKEALGFEPPPIPEFPGWSSFIEFDIPSIPSFPPWATLVGGVDIATLIPPFPGWAAVFGSAPSGPASSPAPTSSAPPFREGTESAPRTGISLVGEEGPELRLINQGDRIFPAGVTSRILGVARSIASSMPTINSPVPTMQPSIRGGLTSMIQTSETVVNNTVQNFNLTTTSLRSTESVNNDFAMMERLGSLA